jgi:hypothetical protein
LLLEALCYPWATFYVAVSVVFKDGSVA